MLPPPRCGETYKRQAVLIKCRLVYIRIGWRNIAVSFSPFMRARFPNSEISCLLMKCSDIYFAPSSLYKIALFMPRNVWRHIEISWFACIALRVDLDSSDTKFFTQTKLYCATWCCILFSTICFWKNSLPQKFIHKSCHCRNYPIHASFLDSKAVYYQIYIRN